MGSSRDKLTFYREPKDISYFEGTNNILVDCNALILVSYYILQIGL